MRVVLLAAGLLGAWAGCPHSCSAQDLGGLGKRFLRGAVRRFALPAQQHPERGAENRPAVTIRITPYVAVTADRWKLVGRRYRAAGKTDPAKTPVVLCHGFGYNGRFFDLDESVSLARYLAGQGFDVWVVDLRGAGQSSKWALSAKGGADALLGRFASQLVSKRVPPEGFVSLDPRYYKWSFDDHVDYDVPAILDMVKRHTGASQVSWVGHSMGGNVMLAYLGKHGQQPSVGRFATVGSQVTMAEGRILAEYLLELLELRRLQFAKRDESVEQSIGEAVAAMDRVFFNEANADRGVKWALLTRGKDVPSIGLIEQYLDLSRSGRLRSKDRRLDYSTRLGSVTCPCLFVGGGADQIAPPVAQKYVYDNVGSQDKTLLILSPGRGFSAAYGHNDSLIGRRSAEEVYPLLARWLAGQAVGPAALSTRPAAPAPR